MESAKRRSLIARVLPRREKRAFGAIEIYPKRLRFLTQNPGEVVYILARAHVIVNLGWAFRLAFLSVVPLVGLYFMDYLQLGIGFVTDELIALIILVYYLMLAGSFIMNLMSWYYDIYLVTSERIIHYDFNPLTSYHVAEAEIENIQDVTQSTIGFLPNIFGYGDITVRTASSKNKFYFKAVPHPVWFRDVIADLSRLIRAKEP
ncbi:MAG: hypothetical protein US52_C0048G0006 [candidate division WS6 bacterium GW2011_GWA2_37_6]|uniref:DUF304 domain-containing protein n=1 Tax=candidate division WS6 bacterium GW2011_GWA2_37_6 TaxID=1619087 RepID=A0A0G0GUT3_9BACT|nr:MAG: hypothetical protein US52_C0048G0006 [candidate division WS6 bacterium GW2011_GWA2_37_6]